ncbi:MAG: proline racemase family protein, partial [Alphaproteobacteria bacterium]
MVEGRLVGAEARVGGVPDPPGATLLDKRAWLWRNDDALRRMLNFEPRGSGMMCSVL